MSSIHPKTSGAALGGALGVMLDAVLHSLHGIHLDPSVYGAITGFLSALGSYLSPSPTPAPAPVPVPVKVTPPAPTPL